MREPTKESPSDRGVVEIEGRCQACGQVGRILVFPGSPSPNELCPRCAIEHGGASVDESLDVPDEGLSLDEQ